MLCLIAGIKTYVPAAGGMASRCREYQIRGEAHEAELVITMPVITMPSDPIHIF